MARTCVSCRRPGPQLCPRCAVDLVDAPDLPVPGVGPVVALFAYEGAGARVVRALKYGDDRRLVATLAGALAHRARPPAGAVVTWVPTSAGRRRRRGFDQAELLARALARRWQLPVRCLLIRSAGPPQTGRSALQRRAGVAFAARGRPPSPAVVVVDDVCTTGSTLHAAAAALRRAGAVEVVPVVVARTP